MSQESWEALDVKREALKKKYADKGIKVAVGYNDPPGVTGVFLDFTPVEWVGLLNISGDFLPACCGEISHVRDLLFNAIRNGNEMRADDLWDAVSRLRHHDGCEQITDDGGPLKKLDDIWEAVKDEVDASPRRATRDLEDVWDAISTISHGTNILTWDALYTKDEKQQFDSKVLQLKNFHRMIPAIRTLHKRLGEMKLEPVVGWGLFCHLTEDGVQKREILETNSGGYAIYRSSKEANDQCKYYTKHLKNMEGGRIQIHNYVVLKVRVSLEQGLEINVG